MVFLQYPSGYYLPFSLTEDISLNADAFSTVAPREQQYM